MSVERLYRRGLRLEYFTVGYNVLEAVASIVFGIIANSIALIGFGLDSISNQAEFRQSMGLWR